jgi:HJR/Mrr/RecB family endonuclease
MALASGRATVLLGRVGEPSIADAFDLPSVAPAGDVAVDARAVSAVIERLKRVSDVPSTATPASAPDLRALVDAPGTLDAVTYDIFENLVHSWFVHLGAEITRAGRTERADFRLRHGERHYLVEVKKLSRQGRVPVESVKKLADAVLLAGNAGGILVTSSPLTAAAESIAIQNNIHVISIRDLVDFGSIDELVRAGSGASSETGAVAGG